MLKKIVGLILMCTLLFTVTLSFTSCDAIMGMLPEDLVNKIPGFGNQGGTEEEPDEDPDDGEQPENPDDGEQEQKPDTPTQPTEVAHTITVVDSKGNAIAGAEVALIPTSGGRLNKTTDAQGKITANLTGEWKAQIISVPEGYYVTAEQFGTKYDFTDAALTITVANATYVFTATDAAGDLYADVTVSIYAYVDGVADLDNVLATATTDAFGTCYVDIAAGKGVYLVKCVFEDEDGRYIADFDTAADGYAYDLAILEPLGDVSNPIALLEVLNNYFTVAPGETKWYTLELFDGITTAMISTSGANATLIYGDEEIELEANDYGLGIYLGELEAGVITFAISCADDAESAADITVAAEYEYGSAFNPYDLYLDSTIYAYVSESETLNAVYYKWMSDFNGAFTFTIPANASVAIVAGDEILVPENGKIELDAVKYEEYIFVFSSVPEDGVYPEAEIVIDVEGEAEFYVYVTDENGAVADVEVSIFDMFDELAATVITDAEGVASVTLDAFGYYYANVGDAFPGYFAEDAYFFDGEAYIVKTPYTLPTLDEDDDQTYYLTVPAGATYYFQMLTSETLNLAIAGDVALVVGGETIENVDGAIAYQIVFSEDDVDENDWFGRAKVLFAIVNDGDDDADVAISWEYLPGSMNNPAEVEVGENTVEIPEGDGKEVFFQFTAEANYKLTITYSDNAYFAEGMGRWNTEVAGVATVDVLFGNTVEFSLGLNDTSAAATVTYTVAVEEFIPVPDGSYELPFVITEGGSFTASVPFFGAVYYSYTAPYATTLTFTSSDVNVDMYETTCWEWFLDASVEEYVVTLAKGETFYFFVQHVMWEEGEITFDIAIETVTCEEHAWNDGEITVEADCENAGEITYTCDDCGATYTEEIEALGHDWDDGEITAEADCENAGEITYTCATCGDIYTEEIEALGHDLEEVEGLDATCTEDGYVAYQACTVCDYTEGEEVIPATGHNMDDGVITTAPTCTEAGEMTYTCLNECGHTETEVVDALGHGDGEWEIVAQPTCTEPGSKNGNCSVCGETLENVEIPALGHNMDDGEITTDPTCTEAGEMTYTCLNECGHTETEAVDALGHTAEWEIVEPTCTEPGSKTGVCETCGEEIAEELEALGHDMVDVEALDPTCTEAGYNAHTACSVCGYTEDKEVIPALGHSYEYELIEAATCIDNGSKLGTCAVCGDEQTVILYAQGHKYVSFAAATDPNYEYATCECGHVQYREKVGAITFASGVLLDSEKLTYVNGADKLADASATEYGDAWTMFSIAEKAENKMLKLAYNYAVKDSSARSELKIGLTDTIRNTATDKYLVYDMDIVIELPEDYDYTSSEYRAVTRITLSDDGNNVITNNDIQLQGAKVVIQYAQTGITLDPEADTKISIRFVYELATEKNAENMYTARYYIFAKVADADQNWNYVGGGSTRPSSYTSHSARLNYFVKIYEEAMSATYDNYFIANSALLIDNVSFIATADDNAVYTACSRTNLSDWAFVGDPCVENTERVRYCLDDECEYEERETVLKGHDIDEWTIVDATCAEDGTKTGNCARCGEVVEVIPSTGHTYGDWTDAADANYEMRACEDCGRYQLREKNTTVADISIDASTMQTIPYTDALHANSNANGGKYNVFEMDFKVGTGKLNAAGQPENSTANHFRINIKDDGNNQVKYFNIDSYGKKVKIDNSTLDAKYVSGDEIGTWMTIRIVDEIPDAANAEGKQVHNIKVFVKFADADTFELVKTLEITTNYSHANRAYKVELSHLGYTYELENASFIRTNDAQYYYYNCNHVMSAWASTDASCEDDAVYTRSCTVDGCGYTETEYAPALGHDLTDWTDAEGNTQVRSCQNDGCDYAISRAKMENGVQFDNGLVLESGKTSVDLLNTTIKEGEETLPMEGAQAITSESTEGGNPFIWYSVAAAPKRFGDTALKIQTVQANNKDPYKGSRYTVRADGTEGNVYTVDFDLYHEKTYADTNSSYIFTQVVFGGATITLNTYGPNIRPYTSVVLGTQDEWISIRIVITVTADGSADANILVKDAEGVYNQVHTMALSGSAIKLDGVSSMYFSSYSGGADHTYYLDNISFTRSAE